jgi:hypothetical protein
MRRSIENDEEEREDRIRFGGGCSQEADFRKQRRDDRAASPEGIVSQRKHRESMSSHEWDYYQEKLKGLVR